MIGDASVPSSPLTATSSPLSEPPDESENRDTNKSVSKTRRATRASLTENPSGDFDSRILVDEKAHYFF